MVTTVPDKSDISPSARAWQHLRAELDDDLEATVGTVSEREAVFVGNRIGTSPTDATTIDTWTDHDAIRARYASRVTRIGVLTPVVEIHGDWWMFLDCVADVVHRTTGATTTVRAATLFPVLSLDDGINGEIWLYDGREAGDPGTWNDAADARRRQADTVRSFIDALAAGDPSRVGELLAPDATTVARSYIGSAERLARVQGGPQFVERYTQLLAGTEIVDAHVRSFVTGDWYVMVECAWTFATRDGERQISTGVTTELFGFAPDGRIATRIGYGTPRTPRR